VFRLSLRTAQLSLPASKFQPVIPKSNATPNSRREAPRFKNSTIRHASNNRTKIIIHKGLPIQIKPPTQRIIQLTPLLTLVTSQNVMFFEDLFESRGIEDGIIRDQSDDVGEVCKEVALVLVGEDGWHTSCLELDVFVVDLDKVDVWILRHERRKGVLDDL